MSKTPWKSVPKPTPSGLTGTEEQTAIWDTLTSTDRELVIDAKAGTGKTTTCIQALHRLSPLSRLKRQRIGFCAFNNAIAQELKTKVPMGMEAGTLHSFMLRVLRADFPNLPVEPKKVRTLTDQLFKGFSWRRGERWAIIKLVGLCKNEGVTLDLLEDQFAFDKFAQQLNDRYTVWSSMTGPGNIPKRTLAILKHCADLTLIPTEGVDFDDMLWLPYLHNIRPTVQYDRLFVDEAQDINRVQMHNALALSPLLTVVGDRNQAIYGFRGADINALDNLKTSLLTRHPTTHELPLTTCWRCPTSVIELAQQIVPTIRHAPQALPGLVDCITPTDLYKLAQPGDMILCRTNAPNIRSVYSFWKRKIKAYIRGREEDGAQLLNLVEQITNDHHCLSLRDFDLRLQQREESDISRVIPGPDSEGRVNLIRDKFASLREIVENCTTLEQVTTDLKSMFSEPPNPKEAVMHSSIHRSKGLESKTVYILEPHLLPHPCARQPWEVQQEYNLTYVAITRAQESLHFVGNIPSILCGDLDQ